MNKNKLKAFALATMLAASTAGAFAQTATSEQTDGVAPQYVITQGKDFKGYIYVLAHYPATKDSKEHEETAYCYLYLNFVNDKAKFDCIIIRPNKLRGLHLKDECPADIWYEAMTTYAMGFFPNSDRVTIAFGENEYKKNINY